MLAHDDVDRLIYIHFPATEIVGDWVLPWDELPHEIRVVAATKLASMRTGFAISGEPIAFMFMRFAEALSR